MASRIYIFKAITNLWTGDIKNKRGRLITTGLLGSIRWWYEIVARGFGGEPCDPSNTGCIDHEHCVVCELFGCTGWARKFRFDVLDEENAGKQTQIEKGQTFKLRFTPLRAVSDEEWMLLDVTLRLIAEHGAIGGKTVFKPTDEANRKGKIYHRDFGLIKLSQGPTLAKTFGKTALQAYASDSKWRGASQNGFAWASLNNFWSVPGQYLARQNAKRSTFNKVIGRGEAKNSSGSGDSWLAGYGAKHQNGPASKKVFSFQNPPRTFGFINPNGGKEKFTLDTIKQRLKNAWEKTVNVDPGSEAGDSIPLRIGPAILDRLLETEAP